MLSEGFSCIVSVVTHLLFLKFNPVLQCVFSVAEGASYHCRWYKRSYNLFMLLAMSLCCQSQECDAYTLNMLSVYMVSCVLLDAY